MGDALVEGTRLVAGVMLLGYASLFDLRTRRVNDLVWMMMGTVGFVLMIYEYLIPDFSVPLLLTTVGAYLAMLDMMLPRPEIYDKEKGFNFFAAILPFSAWTMVIVGAVLDIQAVSIPLMSAGVIAFVYVMYRFDYIAGGADAKALMAISLLVPVIPHMDLIPIYSSEVLSLSLFPFAILAFIYSGAAYIVSMIYFGIKNAIKGDLLFPQMFIGYRLDVHALPNAFVWPMETPESGPVVRVRNLDEVLKVSDYLKAGKQTIWVTPQHPGIAYILLGFILAFIIGNPFLLIGGVT